MDSNKLSEDVINQIKDFPKYDTRGRAGELNFYKKLNQEQKSLIDELIPNEELRERFKKYGLCDECNQPNTGTTLKFSSRCGWCKLCNSKHFQQEFNNWTSGNQEIDKLIQEFQLNPNCCEEVLEWIPYEKFKGI